MSLIIHALSTDRDEHYGQPPTIALRDKSMHMLNLVVTLEKRKDIAALQQVIDAFISKCTTLLPDYNLIVFPGGHKLSMTVTTGKSVYISYLDLEDRNNKFEYQYPVPTEEQLNRPDPETNRTHLENNN